MENLQNVLKQKEIFDPRTAVRELGDGTADVISPADDKKPTPPIRHKDLLKKRKPQRSR